MIEKFLRKAEEYQIEGKYNQAISILKKVLKYDPENKSALYYLSLLYRKLKKWSKSKQSARLYIKLYGGEAKIYETLGDIYAFEGHYKEAIKMYNMALKKVDSLYLKQKIGNTHAILKEKKYQKRIAVIVHEGGDNFTDDIIEKISQKYWIKKIVIPAKLGIYYANVFKIFKHMRTFRRFIKSTPMPLLRKALNWADVTWMEWANHIAVLTSIIKPKRKKLFIRLHRYEAFTEFPFYINYGNVDGMIFVSKTMKNILENRGINLEGVYSEVIYNGVNLNRLKFKKRTKGYNIGWAAHIIPRKNLYLALEIIRGLVDVDSNYKLHIAGDFRDSLYEIHIKHAIKQMKLENNVIFYGWVDDIDQWWEDKNYLLSTSIHESFGYNIVEAMAKGIKPVIYNFYGADELYDSKFLFNTVSEAVEKFLNENYDSEKYRDYIIKKGWTIENQVRNFEEFIHKLLKGDH